MKGWRFILVYLILMVVQSIIGNYFWLARYVLISVLPALILMLPRSYGSIVSMLIAFVTGLAVDFFSTGMVGLSSFALVPLALSRRLLDTLVFGDDQASQEDELSFQHFGAPKMLLSILLSCVLYFALYVWADSAGTVGFWQAFLRFLLSVIVSTPVCAFAARLLRPE